MAAHCNSHVHVFAAAADTLSPSFLFFPSYSEWGAAGNPPATDDGPEGMNPDGLIESNWDQVRTRADGTLSPFFEGMPVS